MHTRSNVWNGLCLAALGATLMSTQVSCKSVECGAGTVEDEGVCTAQGEGVGGNCGSGTVLDPGGSGKCVPDALLCTNPNGCGVCDEGTTIVSFDDAGVRYCQGVGGVIDCNEDLVCPSGTSNKFHMCGRLFDVEDGHRIEGAEGEKLSVLFYDALGFANSTPATRPAPIHQVEVDECGRFKTVTDTFPNGITVPNTQFIAVATEDNTTSGMDEYILTGVVFPGAFNQKIDKVIAFATRNSTDVMWSTTAGLPAGDTFSELGVYLPVFLDPGAVPGTALDPFKDVGVEVPGVTILEGGSVKAANDYYFSDTDPTRRQMIDSALSATGLNGAGLYLNGPLTMFSGQGAVPAGCTGWPSTLAASVPGVVFVQERIATGCM